MRIHVTDTSITANLHLKWINKYSSFSLLSSHLVHFFLLSMTLHLRQNQYLLFSLVPFLWLIFCTNVSILKRVPERRKNSMEGVQQYMIVVRGVGYVALERPETRSRSYHIFRIAVNHQPWSVPHGWESFVLKWRNIHNYTEVVLSTLQSSFWPYVIFCNDFFSHFSN